MRYVLGETLQEYQGRNHGEGQTIGISGDIADCQRLPGTSGMQYEGEINLKDVGFCKMETQQECLAGSLCIPKLLDILGERYKILFLSTVIIS